MYGAYPTHKQLSLTQSWLVIVSSIWVLAQTICEHAFQSKKKQMLYDQEWTGDSDSTKRAIISMLKNQWGITFEKL